MPYKPLTVLDVHGKLIEEPKAPELDRDRNIPLTFDVAHRFALELNRKLKGPIAERLLADGANVQLTAIINEDPLFPFTATIDDNDAVRVSPSLGKSGRSPVLKDLSDGSTRVNQRFVLKTGAREQTKFDLAMLFQSAIHKGYNAAGMEEGSHTKYWSRGC